MFRNNLLLLLLLLCCEGHHRAAKMPASYLFCVKRSISMYFCKISKKERYQTEQQKRGRKKQMAKTHLCICRLNHAKEPHKKLVSNPNEIGPLSLPSLVLSNAHPHFDVGFSFAIFPSFEPHPDQPDSFIARQLFDEK